MPAAPARRLRGKPAALCSSASCGSSMRNEAGGGAAGTRGGGSGSGARGCRGEGEAEIMT
jgi:hypothetical protein